MRPIILILVAILSLYLFKTYYVEGDKKANATTAMSANAGSPNPVPSALPVDIYVATEVNQQNVVYASGTVVPNEEVEIRAEVSGRLIELNIREGGFIKQGDLIAKLDDADLVAQLKKLAFEEQLADQTEARQKRLLEINAIGKEEYEMAVNKVNTLSADKELLEVQLEKTRVVAPFSGRMGLKSISEGAYITPTTVIANLVQTNPAKLDFSIPEKYASKIKTGQSILFSIDVDGNETIKEEATVIAIDPKVDENLRTLKIRARTANSSGRLLPGMFIRVELPLGDEKAIMIPSESIIPILKGKMVYVKRDGKANEVEIQTGLRTDTDVQVEKGLNVGDSIIVSALMSVKAQTPVAVRNVVNQ